jgi:hypothetical protein
MMELRERLQDTSFKRKLLNERMERDKANGVFRLPKSIVPYSNKRLQRDSMPVLKLKLKGEYIGNNGKGADIYAMTPDNMPCLVPDSSFNSRMAVKGSKVQKLKKDDTVKPE